MMLRLQARHFLLVFLLALVLGVGGMTWLRMNLKARYWPIGVDAYHIWVGSRAVLSGVNPYQEAVKAEAQQLIFGNTGNDDPNIFKVYYPAYIALVMLPLTLLPITSAATVWSGAMWAILATFVLIWSWFQQPRLTPPLWGLVLLTGLFYRPALLAALNGQYALFALACGALGWWLLSRRLDFLAGAVLALTTIKPSVALFLPAILLLWALRWKRWQVVGGFAVGMLLLFGITFILIGWWIPDFIRQVLAYGAENPGAAWSPANIAMPPGLAWLGLSVLLLGLGLRALWREDSFPWLAMIGAMNLNLILTPHIVEYDLTMMLIPLFWLGSQWRAIRFGWAMWFILMWLPWLSWGGVVLSGSKLDDWWKGIWLTYPLLLVLLMSLRLAWGRLGPKRLWMRQAA